MCIRDRDAGVYLVARVRRDRKDQIRDRGFRKREGERERVCVCV